MPYAEYPGQSSAPHTREVLTRRPSQPPTPGPPTRGQAAWWRGACPILLGFTVQVLLRPARIGTLALLGGMIGVVVVGAEGWWIVLGIILFQAAACALTVLWVDTVDTRVVRSPHRQPEGRQIEHPPVGHQQTGHRQAEPWQAESPSVPRPRRPRPDE